MAMAGGRRAQCCMRLYSLGFRVSLMTLLGTGETTAMALSDLKTACVPREESPIAGLLYKADKRANAWQLQETDSTELFPFCPKNTKP